MRSIAGIRRLITDTGREQNQSNNAKALRHGGLCGDMEQFKATALVAGSGGKGAGQVQTQPERRVKL